jgi:hypothetical protein
MRGGSLDLALAAIADGDGSGSHEWMILSQNFDNNLMFN